MRITKLKLISTMLFFVPLSLGALSTSAHAQIGVKDDTGNGILSNIEPDIDNISKKVNTEFDATNKHRMDETTHYNAQIEHYEDQIKRINALISVMQSAKVSADGTIETNLSNLKANADFFESSGVSPVPASNTIADRGLIAKLRADAQSGSGASKRENFLKEYGFKPVSSFYDNNEVQKLGLEKLYNTVYNNDLTVHRVSDASEARLARYEVLTGNAKDASDIKTSLDVNNALLIENGRNLALLIDLQTAQLDAAGVQLHTAAQGKNTVARAFGENTTLGLATLGFISKEINELTDINHSEVTGG